MGMLMTGDDREKKQGQLREKMEGPSDEVLTNKQRADEGSTAKDRRVKELLLMKSRDARIQMLHTLVKDGKLDLKNFTDLFKIVAREVEVAEIQRMLQDMANKYGKQTPDQVAELAALKGLRGGVIMLARKAAVSCGMEETK